MKAKALVNLLNKKIEKHGNLEVWIPCLDFKQELEYVDFEEERQGFRSVKKFEVGGRDEGTL